MVMLGIEVEVGKLVEVVCGGRLVRDAVRIFWLIG